MFKWQKKLGEPQPAPIPPTPDGSYDGARVDPTIYGNRSNKKGDGPRTDTPLAPKYSGQQGYYSPPINGYHKPLRQGCGIRFHRGKPRGGPPPDIITIKEVDKDTTPPPIRGSVLTISPPLGEGGVSIRSLRAGYIIQGLQCTLQCLRTWATGVLTHNRFEPLDGHPKEDEYDEEEEDYYKTDYYGSGLFTFYLFLFLIHCNYIFVR